MLRIGLVMLQGDRHSHIAALRKASEESSIEIEVHELRKASDLQSADPHGMVIPGGESTTMRLTGNDPASSLLPALFDWMRENPSMPVLGTCAGAILLADPEDGGKPLVDAGIDRNAFGTQTDSFQASLQAIELGREFPGVFIRAPRFTGTGPDGETAATIGEEIVGVRTANRVALTFHPELSPDPGFHVWLLETAKSLEMS